MWKKKTVIIFVFFVVLFMVSLVIEGETQSSLNKKGGESVFSGEKEINAYYFYGQGCPHCKRVEPFIAQMEHERSLAVHKYEIYHHRDNVAMLNQYFDMHGVPTERRGIPALFVSNSYLVGDEPILTGFEEVLGEVAKKNSLTVHTYDFEAESPKDLVEEGACDESAGNSACLSIVTLTTAALVDSVSPCSLAVLLFLIGVRPLVPDRRKRALKVGLAFSSSVFLSYTFFGLGLLSVIRIAGLSSAFGVVAGLVAVLVGIFYVKDYFWHGSSGFVMEVPRSLRPLVNRMIKGATNPLGVFLIGFVIFCFELPCTGGPYLFILGQLANSATRLQSIPMLLYYNFLFIAPLLSISLFLYFGFFSLKRARQWNDRNKSLLRLVSGPAMIALGILVMPSSELVWLVRMFLGVCEVVLPTVLLILSFYHTFSILRAHQMNTSRFTKTTLLVALSVLSILIYPQLIGNDLAEMEERAKLYDEVEKEYVYEPYRPVSVDLLKPYEPDYQKFKGYLIGDKIVYFRKRKIGDAIVEKDSIIYHFDKDTKELLKKIVRWRDDLSEKFPEITVSKEQAESVVEGEVSFSILFIISPESDVFPIKPTPKNPCWVVSSKKNDLPIVTIIDAITGEKLGYGIPPPYTAFSLTGPEYFEPCSGSWNEHADNARDWFNTMGYSTERVTWPTQATIQSHVQSHETAMIYEIAHGGSTYFWSGCVGGTSFETTTATEIETWIADYNKVPFTFIGSCWGMCSTGDNTLSYEFRKGSTIGTTTVGYCGMDKAACEFDCWPDAIPWQNKLFECMNNGDTVKHAFDNANADYPGCVDDSWECMRFAGDISLKVKPVVKREPGCGDTVTGDTWLSRDLSCPGDGLIIGPKKLTARVTLDCQGHTIQGSNIGIGIENTYPFVTIKNCIIRDFDYGIYMHDVVTGNIIYGNTISENEVGINVGHSAGNTIYWNSFVNNTYQVNVSNPSDNAWDNGYPSGGNYWSDYNGTDFYNGPSQNELNSDGIGDTPYVIVFEGADNYPLMKPYGGPYDIGITNITTSKTVVGQGYNLNITIKIINYGINTETFNLTAYANTTIIQTITNVVLASRNSTTITFTWNTTDVPYGNYTIKAVAHTAPGEIDTDDNTLSNSVVMITVPGDVNGDRIVDIFDIGTISSHWYPGPPIGPLGYDSNSDINNDSAVDIFDIGITSAHWGQSW